MHDLILADAYDPLNPVTPSPGHNTGSNGLRWDTADQLSEPVLSRIPSMKTAGNHEIESTGIGAQVNYTTYSFAHLPLDQRPFQAWAARNPVPGTKSDFGNVDKNQYYSTVIGGKIKVITLNNYVSLQGLLAE